MTDRDGGAYPWATAAISSRYRRTAAGVRFGGVWRRGDGGDALVRTIARESGMISDEKHTERHRPEWFARRRSIFGFCFKRSMQHH